MTAAIMQVGSSPLSGIASAMSALFQDPPAPSRPASSQGDVFDAQYSPQIYSIVANGSNTLHFSVLESNTYNMNIAFPPLSGTSPGFIPSLPPASTITEQTIIAGTEREITSKPVASGVQSAPVHASHAQR